MKRYWILAVLGVAIAGALSQGCNQAGAKATTTGGGATNTPAPAYPGLPTKAQSKLATINLRIGNKEEMIAEMAVTPIQVQTGMMFRTNMAENEGMIFVLDAPQQAKFWMMNCPMPLSAAYIDEAGQILEIHPLQPHNTNSVVSRHYDVRFVLETKQGWFERHNIKEGTAIATEKGSLKKTFLDTR